MTHLNLSGTKVGDAGIKELAGLKKMQFLTLNTTEITDEALKTIARFDKLIYLNVRGSKKVTPEGIAELQKALPKTKIIK